MKPQIACDSITGNFSISQIPTVDVDDTKVVMAIDNLNEAISGSCKLQSMEGNAKIAEAIDALNVTISSNALTENLLKALDNLNNTLSSTPSGSLTEVLSGAIFSVIAAFTFNFLYWKVKERKERLRAAINEAKDALFDFEENAVEYWSSDYNPRNAKTNTIQQAKIKANHSLLLSTYTNRVFPLLSNSQKASEKMDVKKNIQLEVENLFDIATGGDFESSSRKASKKNVSDIILRCTRIRTRLANLGS
ncbi:hypothetical protein [Vibrio parahaemolyticus]